MIRFAAFGAQLFSSNLPLLFAISVAGFLALAFLPQGGLIAEICGTFSTLDLGRLLVTAPWMVSPIHIVLNWVIMVIAMMTPLIAPMLVYVQRSVPLAKRKGASLTFLAAYWGVWSVTLAILFPATILLMSVTGDDLGFPFALMFAFVFSTSPMAQRARNACHQTVRIGTNTLRDSSCQGCITGLRCVAACWPWMLVPQTIITGHMTVMILITLYLFADRIAPAAQPRWQLPPAFATIIGPVVLRYDNLRLSTAQ